MRPVQYSRAYKLKISLVLRCGSGKRREGVGREAARRENSEYIPGLLIHTRFLSSEYDIVWPFIVRCHDKRMLGASQRDSVVVIDRCESV